VLRANARAAREETTVIMLLMSTATEEALFGGFDVLRRSARSLYLMQKARQRMYNHLNDRPYKSRPREIRNPSNQPP
jgi:hypothetical protein